jgi:anti-sigma B factor antagonist
MQEKMKIQKERKVDIEIIDISGILDAHTAIELEESINETIQQGIYKIIISLRNLEYISSAGLGVFMAFIEEIRNKNGDIKFSEMDKKILSIFELLGFNLIFDILSNTEEAIEYFETNRIRKNE